MKKKNNQLSDVKYLVDKTLQKLEKDINTPKDELKTLLKKIKALHLEPGLQNELIFKTTLYSIGDAVITTDKQSKIQNMNKVAEKLTGWKEKDAKGKALEKIFKIVNEVSKKEVQNSVKKVLKSGRIVGLANHTLLINKTGKEIPIADSSAPIKNDSGEILGVVLVFRDQTKECEQQHKLEERERKFSTLVSNLPGFIYRCRNDKHWTMEFISEGCKDITGFSPDDFINNNKLAFNDIIHPEYKVVLWNEWQIILKEKKYFEFSYPIITKNKKIKWVWERGRGVYSSTGKLLFLEGFITDITDKKEMEDSLKMFKFATDQSPESVFWMKKDGGLYYVNDNACKSLGYTKDELLKLKVFDIDPYYPKNTWRKAWKKFSSTEISSEKLETYHKRKDGTIFPIEVTAMHCLFGNFDLHIAFVRNISERKISEQLVKESERRYKALYDNSPDVIFLADVNSGIILDANDVATKITGYKKEELIGKHQSQLHPKRTEVTVKKGFEFHTQTDSNIPLENLLLCKDGREIPMEATASVIEVNGKKILQGVFRDITKRKLTEEKLINSEISFKNIFNSVSEAIYILDEQGIFIDVNDGATNMYGYSREELIGKTPADVSVEGKNDLNNVAIALQNAFKNKKQQFEFWGKRKNGEGFLKDVRLYPGKFFNRNVVIAVARDITKEKEAEIALRNSEERYKLIAENTIDSIAVFDLNLNYTYLSPSVKKLLGYTPEELANIGLFKILTPKSAEYVSQLVSNELFKVRSGNNNLTSNIVVETQQYTKDGSIIWVESSLSVLRDATGTPTGILAVSRDVTARKKVEAALAESEERYRTISSLTSDYLFSTSIDEYGNQQLVWVAGSFEKITGYTMQEYISAGGWKVKLHEEDIEKDISDMNKLMSNQKVISEIRTIHKNGNIIWVRTYAQPVWDYDKNILIGIYGAVEDITQFKLNEMLQKIQYNIADAVVTSKSLNQLFESVRNELSNSINVNNFFIALYDELTGMLSSDVDSDEMESISVWPAKNSMTGYVIEKQHSIILNKDEINGLISSGKAGMVGIIPEIWLGVPFKVSGKVIGVLVVQSYDNRNAFNKNSVEILEIVAHELSIFIQHKKSEEEKIKLSVALEQSPVSILITDPTGKIEYVNPKFTAVSGYSLDEVKGDNPRVLKSGKHTDEFYKNIWDTILSGNDWQGELLNKKKNGELFWENAIISPIINSDGVITNFVAIKEDISEKKLMIEALIRAKDEAEEMNRVKSSFFANMSHELRTPMVGILGFSEVLMTEFKETPELFHMIKSINISGRRLLETLNMILNLSKLEAAKVETNIVTTNIITILRESFNSFESAAIKKMLNYDFYAEQKEILCDIDTNLFQSIFNNLLNNAIKFTDFGYIKLKVKLNNGLVLIQVSDSGVGISQDKLKIIWEEFRQASEGYSRSFEGTGLGLTIAKRHTELMNGNISVDSVIGSGTTFSVSFPISKNQTDNKPTFEHQENEFDNLVEDLTSIPKILYVEDDDVSVMYVKTITNNIYKVDSAKDSEEALDLIKKEKYDAILMDINLRRGMDGLELTNLIKKFPNYKNTPIIAVTAFAMGQEKEEFLSKGLTHYLAKPFIKQQLYQVLKEAIKKN